VYVDFDTQRRVLKDSALWYRDFIASHRPWHPAAAGP
jgi:beta-glucosidase